MKQSRSLERLLPFLQPCVRVGVEEVHAGGRGERLHYRSIKGSVVITAEAVSLTSRLHYLVSFVSASPERLIE